MYIFQSHDSLVSEKENKTTQRSVLSLLSMQTITKTHLFKYIENFTCKNWKFSDKINSDIFHFYHQNVDCGFSLEPHCRGSSNEYP